MIEKGKIFIQNINFSYFLVIFIILYLTLLLVLTSEPK